MAKIVSQETYDNIIEENIVEFGMNAQEAKEEAIQQLEAQGVNLMNIIKDLDINTDTGKPILNEIVHNLQQYITTNTNEPTKLLEYLVNLEKQCEKSLAHRVQVHKLHATDALLQLLQANTADVADIKILEQILRTLKSLTKNQPDIFNETALACATKLLHLQQLQVQCLTVQWLQHVCTMHEKNRQQLMQAELYKTFKPWLNEQQDRRLLSNVLILIRCLVLDDDVRVEFGNAHEHARLLANYLLVELTQLLAVSEDSLVLSELLLTISALTVRQEFCVVIENAGGLQAIIKLMQHNAENLRIQSSSLKLLRALAGNDTVKLHIVEEGLAPIIKEIMDIHQSHEPLIVAALACISSLTLRVRANSVAFFETGIAGTIAACMAEHAGSKMVQRNAAWAIRNMVSRSREQCEVWLSHGIEDLLNTALQQHADVQQDIKSALRDLGCRVDLKEEWTGVAEKKILND